MNESYDFYAYEDARKADMNVRPIGVAAICDPLFEALTQSFSPLNIQETPTDAWELLFYVKQELRLLMEQFVHCLALSKQASYAEELERIQGLVEISLDHSLLRELSPRMDEFAFSEAMKSSLMRVRSQVLQVLLNETHSLLGTTRNFQVNDHIRSLLHRVSYGQSFEDAHGFMEYCYVTLKEHTSKEIWHTLGY